MKAIDEKAAGDPKEDARRRHVIAFGPVQRVRTSGMTRGEINTINDAILNRVAALIPARETIADRFHAALVEEFTGDLADLMRVWDTHDIIEDLAQDATKLYQSIRRREESDRATRGALRRYTAENAAALDKRIDSIIRRAPTSAFSADPSILRAFYVLFAESGGAFITRALRGEFDVISKTLFSYEKSATLSKADEFLIYFTLGEGELPPLPASTQIAELADSIATRANKITAVPLTNAMFENVRTTIKTELYDAIDGGSGAEEIARKLGKNLRDQFATSLPPIANDRLMLWARTEGCTVQNDALMARSKDLGMEGKVWQTVGDARVRPAHSLNEAAGVIPANATFPDGSTDGGSGSVSPFNCRCAVSGALIPDKSPKSSKPTTATKPTGDNAKKPPTPTPKPKPKKKPKKEPTTPIKEQPKAETHPLAQAESTGTETAAAIAEETETAFTAQEAFEKWTDDLRPALPPEPPLPKPKPLQYDSASGEYVGYGADGVRVSFPTKFEYLYNEEGILVPNPSFDPSGATKVYAPGQTTAGNSPPAVTPHIKAKENVLAYDEAAFKSNPAYHPSGQPFTPETAQSLGKYQNVYDKNGNLVKNPYFDKTTAPKDIAWGPGQKAQYDPTPDITTNKAWQAKKDGFIAHDQFGLKIPPDGVNGYVHVYDNAGNLVENPYYAPANPNKVFYAPGQKYKPGQYLGFDQYGNPINASDIGKYKNIFNEDGKMQANAYWNPHSKEQFFKPGDKYYPGAPQPATQALPHNASAKNAGVFDVNGNPIHPSVLSDSKFVYDKNGNYIQNPYYIKQSKWHAANESPQWVKDLAKSPNAPKVYNAEGKPYKHPEATWKAPKIFDKYGDVIDNPYYDGTVGPKVTPSPKAPKGAPSKAAEIKSTPPPAEPGQVSLSLDANTLKTYATQKEGSYAAINDNAAESMWRNIREKTYKDIEAYVKAGYATQAEFDAFKNALSQYKGSLYGAINSILRNKPKTEYGPTVLRAAEQAIKAMERFSRVAKITDNLTLYRGVDSINGKRLFDQFANMTGGVYSDSAFASSSLSEGKAVSFASGGDYGVVFVVRTPNGANFMLGTDYERELVLPPGTSLRIDDATKVVDKHGTRMRYVYCTLIA